MLFCSNAVPSAAAFRFRATSAQEVARLSLQ